MTQQSADRPLGEKVENWTPPPRPEGEDMTGRYVQLERLDANRHAADLFRAYSGHDALWDYMPDGPFHSQAAFHRWAQKAAESDDPYHWAIRDLTTGQAVGQASFLRIAPQAGSIEVGYICFSPALQRTKGATEAMALMMRRAFELGYRRYEWKCDALNAPSRRAAQRLGFSYEGVFRQAVVVKGRNRDTAWFAVIDKDWPALEEAFRVWLDPSNFDDTGAQTERLGDLTALVRVAADPTL
jgi:RimJ/RimL family protein N-acetyltransferase